MFLKTNTFNLDFIGISISLLCALHCLTLPIVLAASTYGGLIWLESPVFEWVIIVLSLIIASWSLFRSYWNKHGKIMPLVVVAFGFIFIAAGRVTQAPWEHFLTAMGGFAIAYAHFLNWRFLGALCKLRKKPVSNF